MNNVSDSPIFNEFVMFHTSNLVRQSTLDFSEVQCEGGDGDPAVDTADVANAQLISNQVSVAIRNLFNSQPVVGGFSDYTADNNTSDNNSFDPPLSFKILSLASASLLLKLMTWLDFHMRVLLILLFRS